MPDPEIDKFATDMAAPLSIESLPPAKASVPSPLVVPLRLAVPVSESVSALDMLSFDPAPSLKAPA